MGSILETSDILVCDANVLIDFIKAGAERILKEIGKLHRIYIPTPIFNEVKQLTSCKLKDLGLFEFIPEFELLSRSAEKIGQCSPQDVMCLLICEENGWYCITNDKNLRYQCANRGVKTIWGLQLILYLKEKNILTIDAGKKICLKIADINKTITRDIVDKFVEKIEKQI
jgi:rRNA-processing protein FCF1